MHNVKKAVALALFFLATQVSPIVKEPPLPGPTITCASQGSGSDTECPD